MLEYLACGSLPLSTNAANVSDITFVISFSLPTTYFKLRSVYFFLSNLNGTSNFNLVAN